MGPRLHVIEKESLGVVRMMSIGCPMIAVVTTWGLEQRHLPEDAGARKGTCWVIKNVYHHCWRLQSCYSKALCKSDQGYSLSREFEEGASRGTRSIMLLEGTRSRAMPLLPLIRS